MKFGRYKNFNWKAATKRREKSYLRVARMPIAPPVLLELNARLLLEAYHKGPWRSIWAQIKHELGEVWQCYFWRKWEWVRTRVFRLRPDPDLEDWQRMTEEQDALDEMSAEL